MKRKIIYEDGSNISNEIHGAFIDFFANGYAGADDSSSDDNSLNIEDENRDQNNYDCNEVRHNLNKTYNHYLKVSKRIESEEIGVNERNEKNKNNFLRHAILMLKITYGKDYYNKEYRNKTIKNYEPKNIGSEKFGYDEDLEKMRDDLMELSVMINKMYDANKKATDNTINESLLLENKLNDIDDLIGAFVDGGLEKAGEVFREKGQVSKNSQDDLEKLENTLFRNYKKCNNEDFNNRLNDFQTNYLSNNSIKILGELYKKYKNLINVIGRYKENTDVYNKLSAINNIHNFIVEGNEDNEELSDNEYIIRLRFKILGIDMNDDIHKKLKSISDKELESGFTQDYLIKELKHDKEFKNQLYNENNLIQYLTDEEWEIFSNTFVRPDKLSNNEETDKKNIRNHVKKIKGMLEVYLFETKVPDIVDNYFKRVKEECDKRLIPGTYKFYNFGEHGPHRFYIDIIKNNYKEYCKKNTDILTNLKAIDIIDLIGPEKFWENVAYIDCRTRQAQNDITAIIGNTGNTGLIISSRALPKTQLNTNTILYILLPTNEKNKSNDFINNIDMRKGGKFVNYIKKEDNEIKLKITPADIRDIKEFERAYFLIVSEGYFRKGKLINDIFSKIKGKSGISSDLSGLKRLMGIE